MHTAWKASGAAPNCIRNGTGDKLIPAAFEGASVPVDLTLRSSV